MMVVLGEYCSCFYFFSFASRRLGQFLYWRLRIKLQNNWIPHSRAQNTAFSGMRRYNRRRTTCCSSSSSTTTLEVLLFNTLSILSVLVAAAGCLINATTRCRTFNTFYLRVLCRSSLCGIINACGDPYSNNDISHKRRHGRPTKRHDDNGLNEFNPVQSLGSDQLWVFPLRATAANEEWILFPS